MHKSCKFIGVLLFLSLMVSIFVFKQDRINAADSVTRPIGWTEETHGKSGPANYDLLFSDSQVLRFDIVISAANYKTMEDDLATWSMPMTGSARDPVYVPATVKFNNLTWWDVGIRYKGESTLSGPKMSRKHKYPFRLNFDKFEDTYPEIEDQRFYGFKELIFNNNWYDSSLLRDKVCGDIFRSAGIPTPRSAFTRVYIDSGNGPVYWGLYTMYEEPSNQMLKSQFTNGKGNLYKGLQVSGADLTFFNQQSYEKKTNEDANDWSDLQALVTALNASRSNAAVWRTGLEGVFNVNLFLRWLAVNTSIINYDTYGWVTKNHYLYQDLANGGRLTYIPWDFNLSLGGYNMFNIPIPSLSLSEISKQWPLIRFLMDDPVYKNIYHQEMQAALIGCFNQTTVTAEIRQFHDLIRPYVVGTGGESGTYSYLTNGATEFDNSFTTLLNHIVTRNTAVQNYLASVIVTPTLTPTSTPTPTLTPTPNPGVYAVSYEQNDWGGGATVTVTIKNNNSTAINGWTLVWSFPGNQKITNLWNGSYNQNGATVSVSNMAYNSVISANGSLNFGFNISYSGTNAKPTGFTLNGTACQAQ